MAQNNISVASLFGIPTTEDFKFYRQQENFNKALEANPKDPFARAFAFAGEQLGQNFNTMLGGRDPELERVTKINAVGKMVQDMGVDPSNPDEVYPAMIKGFQQAGLMQEAMMASQQYQAFDMKRQEQIIERQKAQAALTNAMNKKTENDPSMLKAESPFIVGAKYVLGRDITRTTDLTPEEFKAVKDWSDNYMKDMETPKEFGSAGKTEFGIAPKRFMYQYTDEEAKKIQAYLDAKDLEGRKASKPETKIENKIAVEAAKSILEVDQKKAMRLDQIAESSREALSSLATMADAYRGGMVTGSLADQRLNLMNFFDMVGINTQSARNSVQNNELFNKEAQKLIRSLMKSYGTNPSNNDLAAAAASMPNYTNSAQGIQALVNVLIKAESAKVKEADAALEHFRNNNGSFKGFNFTIPVAVPISKYTNLSDEELNRRIEAARKNKGNK